MPGEGVSTLPKDDDSTYSVLVLDMARCHDPDGERVVQGFATLEAARAYAETRTRASVEELRGDKTAAEIRSLWHLYGEDCIVPGDGYRGRDALDLYIAVPAAQAELDWPAMTPRPKRFRTTLLFFDANGESVWTGGVIHRYKRPSRAVLAAIFRANALSAFAAKGIENATLADVHVANLFELFAPPEPQIGKALKRWRIDVDFVCHDVKFGSSSGGVFVWPERPEGGVLQDMLRVLVGDMLAMRGDGPSYVDYSDVLKTTVEETSEEPDYQPWPDETSIPSGT